MDIKPIRTDTDYQTALREIETLMIAWHFPISNEPARVSLRRFLSHNKFMSANFRILMLILAVVQGLFTGLTAFTGAFADGGQWWEYATMVVVHPLAAIGLLALVITSRPARALIATAAALLLLAVAADILCSFAWSVSLGATGGSRLYFQLSRLSGLAIV